MPSNNSRKETLENLRALIASHEGGEATGGASFEDAPKRKGGSLRKDEAPADSGIEKPPDQAAYERVLTLCGYHEFASSKMRERLKREGFDPEAIEEAIERATSIGALDDDRWAEMRVFTLYGRGMGQQGITRELAACGIDVSTVEGWPFEFEARYGGELVRALDILRKSPPRSKNMQSAAYGKLMRKGYSPSIASEASRIFLEELQD